MRFWRHNTCVNTLNIAMNFIIVLLLSIYSIYSRVFSDILLKFNIPI